MKQEIKIALSEEQSLTLIKDDSGLIKIGIRDEGWDIDYAIEADVFFEVMKKTCDFDTNKHYYLKS